VRGAEREGMDRRVNHIPSFADRTLHLINARDIRCPVADPLSGPRRRYDDENVVGHNGLQKLPTQAEIVSLLEHCQAP
jgi:hypothetical protein